MRVAVIGPGAMGSLFAAALTEGGREVVLVDHRADRAERLAREGFTLSGVRGHRAFRLPVVSDSADLRDVEWVLLAVKAHQTGQAVAHHHRLLGRGLPVWCLQNGWGQQETLAGTLPPPLLLCGVTTQAVTFGRPGEWIHTAEGETFVGTWSGGPSPWPERIAAACAASGMPVQACGDIRRRLMEKLLLNAGINAISAILGVSNGELLEHPAAWSVAEQAVREGVAVAARHGHAFDEGAMLRRLREVARATAGNVSSTLQDVRRNRPTEIDFLNGAIARLGRAPVNATLTSLVHALEHRCANPRGAPSDGN
jgi:2-dehydropantoate 2-reductase